MHNKETHNMTSHEHNFNPDPAARDRLDIAIGRALSFIAGMGFLAACIAAGLIWGGK